MKRIIFTLLYSSGQFVLSRNFRTQNIGNIDWILKNYNLSEVTKGLDEILILDVSRENKNFDKFCEIVKVISSNCFIPVSAGGGISNINQAETLFKSGADKVFLNSLYFKKIEECFKISKIFGNQSIIGGIDFKKINNQNYIFKDYGKYQTNLNINEWVNFLQENGAGEILLQSIDRDGTASGLELDKELLSKFNEVSCPIILMGGVGKIDHFLDAFKNDKIEAIATANLLNFIGDTFLKLRKNLLINKVEVVDWGENDIRKFKNQFND